MRIGITLAEEVKLTMVEKQRGTEKRSRRKHDETGIILKTRDKNKSKIGKRKKYT